MSDAPKWAPITGVIAVVLLVAAALIGGEPVSADDPIEEIVDYFDDDKQQLSAALGTLGALFLVFFAGSLSARLRRSLADPTLPAVTFGGGLALAIGFAIFSGITFTAAETVNDLEPGGIQVLAALNEWMFFPAALGNAAFYLAAGLGVVKSGALPVWLGWVAVVLGVLSVTPVGFIALIAGGIWIIVASIMMVMSPAAGARA